MMDNQRDQVSSTTSTYCYPICDDSCDNLYHYPDYKWTMRNRFTRFNPNNNCHDCFPSLLVASVELLIATCEDMRRKEILSDTFVSLAKSIFKPAIRNYAICVNSHENPPPHYFCSRCFKLLLEDILITFYQYNVIKYENMPTACAIFYAQFVGILANCQNGCIAAVGG